MVQFEDSNPLTNKYIATMEEEYFPRGGTKPKDKNDKNKGKFAKENLFSLSANEKKKSKKRKRKTSLNDNLGEITEITATVAENLNIQVVQEGMLILGCVRHTTAYTLDIDLPGILGGKVQVTNVSDNYTKLLKKTVENNNSDDLAPLIALFEVGQFVPTKVIQKKQLNEHETSIDLSVNPLDINSNLKHTSFVKGMTIWASVLCELDHGYQLDAGVPNTRIFLPSKFIGENKIIKTGQPLWCYVTKSSVTSLISTVTVSILEQHTNNIIEKDLNLQEITPGMCFDFTVTKEVKDGLQGTFLNQYVGYINCNYLKEQFQNLSKYKPGNIVKAWLLYIQPTTKLGYFCLRSTDVAPSGEHRIGNIITAEIVSLVGSNLCVKSENREKCIIPYKRYIQTLPQHASLKEAIVKKFPNGSYHKCRILNFNRLEQVYIGSFQPSIINEKYFTVDDLKIGEMVQVKVKEIIDQGIVVSLGYMEAFIQNAHLSDVAYSNNIKKKFSVGQLLKSRIWTINQKRVKLTLKQSLLNCEVCLTFDDTKVGKEYTGVVLSVVQSGILLKFFGGIIGFLSKHEMGQQFYDFNKMFFVGQAVKTVIKVVTKDKLYLTLNGPRVRNIKKVVVGQLVEGIISKISKDGIQVQVGTNKIEAFLPTTHLSSSLSLCQNLLDTYQKGDVLKELLCLSCKGKPLLSISEAIYYKNQDFNMPKVDDLTVGSSFRCYYDSSYEGGIEVISSCGRTLKISYKDLLDILGDKNNLHFAPYQVLVVKIKKIDLKHNLKHVIVTAKLVETYNQDIKRTINISEQYLLDIERIRTHYLKNNSALAKIHMGQRVSCVINQVNNLGCSVFINNDIQGLASKRHCPLGIKKGDTLTGVVLWTNFKDNFVEVSLLPSVIESVNEIQDGNINKELESTIRAQILISQHDYNIGVLKGPNGNKQLVFLPAKIHENAFTYRILYDEFQDIKLIIAKKIDNFVIGLDRAAKRLLLKNVAKVLKKRSLSSNERGSAKKARKTRSKNDEFKVEIKLEDEDTEIKYKEVELNDDESMKEKSFIADNDDSCNEIKKEVEENNQDLPKNIVFKNIIGLHSNTETFPSKLSFITAEAVYENSFEQSDNDEVVSNEEKTENKKITPFEQKQLIRQKQEDLIKKEKENADILQEPETVDQFEKYVKGNPNCSKTWTKFVASLVCNKQIEKAKSVARQAVNSISANLTQEKYNMWLVMLNLENNYGTPKSFDEVFEEASRRNDDLSTYLDTIEILRSSEKYDQMEDKIKKTRKKFKTEPKMWCEIASVYYKLKKLNDARNIRTMAMKCVDPKSYTNLVVKFAVMEFQMGEPAQGEALFENTLTLYPKRVDIWSTYFDQCVKIKKDDIVKRIMDRAAEAIPPKKIQGLLKKFQEYCQQNT